MSLSTAVVFIVCHAGPADHFSVFAEDLARKGYEVQIYAAGPALAKLQDRKVERVVPFSLEGVSEEAAATALAQRCARAGAVITDVGHPFDIALQETLALRAPKALRLAYYDNPESYVPGGYSEVAAKVMQAAQKVLFANANLAEKPVYRVPSQEIGLAPERKIGLGYYPIGQAEKIAKRRTADREEIRAQLFSQLSLKDEGQKICVYVGGNNDAYFSKAFPAFLQFLGEASRQGDLSHFIVLLQQHPGAKDRNLDVKQAQQWQEQFGRNAKAPQFFVSALHSEDAQVVADGILYYQTSMGPQFALAGIPTVQVGHEVYEDLLVKNGLCAVATDVKALIHALMGLQAERESGDEAIHRGLGIRLDWPERLETVLKN